MSDAENDIPAGDHDRDSRGSLAVVGIGPGNPDDRTHRAERAIRGADVIFGYRPYLQAIADITQGKELRPSGMRQERERVDAALDEVIRGNNVALVSSGDAGIYGMAGVALERSQARQLQIRIEIVPGVTAAAAAAARFGAPLMLDYVTLSLSDLLVPWDRILHRVRCVAEADLVLALYNPRSQKRTAQLTEVREILLQHRSANTPVGLARALGSPEETHSLSTLGSFDEHEVDMRSILIIGNSTTRASDGWMLTPRGYYT